MYIQIGDLKDWESFRMLCTLFHMILSRPMVRRLLTRHASVPQESSIHAVQMSGMLASERLSA